MTDEELDLILSIPGYEIIKPPENYKPTRKTSTASTVEQSDMYQIPTESGSVGNKTQIIGDLAGNLPNIKPEDVNYFSALLSDVDESKLSPEELRDRRIMSLSLKIKMIFRQFENQQLD